MLYKVKKEVQNAPPFNDARSVESAKRVTLKGRCSGPFEEMRNKKYFKIFRKKLYKIVKVV